MSKHSEQDFDRVGGGGEWRTIIKHGGQGGEDQDGGRSKDVDSFTILQELTSTL